MRDLAHQRGAMRVDALRERLEVGDHRVRGEVELAAIAQLESTSTIEEPPKLVSASPPLAFSSW